MPIFDFRCEDCSAQFELLVMQSSTPVCPQCGSSKLEKQMCAPIAQGKSAEIVAGARRQAAREGHFSNYKPSERPRR